MNLSEPGHMFPSLDKIEPRVLCFEVVPLLYFQGRSCQALNLILDVRTCRSS